MALINGAPSLGSAYLLHLHQGGAENRVRTVKYLRYDCIVDERWRRWERSFLRVEALKAASSADHEDDNQKRNVFAADDCDSGDDEQNEAKEFRKEAIFLPKPLTAFEFSPPSDGSNMRVAYQGLPGSYNEEAVLKAYPKCKTVPSDDYEAVVKAVELRSVDRAVLPIENSVAGSIHRNYDLLLRHKLHIVGEVKLEVNFCLLGLPGVKIEDLKRVSSHPLALAQCERMLSSLGVVKTTSDDTASAAKGVASNGARDTGAIASSRAAKLYGLDILADRVQDDDDNVTRFLILAREPVIPGTKKIYKTSIAFILEEGSGVLFKALGVFSLRNISLTKIESRPLKECQLRRVDDSSSNATKSAKKCFDYLFYIDFEASMAEIRAQSAMEHLQEFTIFLRVLGCYPVD